MYSYPSTVGYFSTALGHVYNLLYVYSNLFHMEILCFLLNYVTTTVTLQNKILIKNCNYRL